MAEESLARLSGTGRLADDLYLLAHHEVTGRPHLQPRAAGLGLAGALLAELMLSGEIRLRADRVVAEGRCLPEDELARSVLKQVAAESGSHSARDWLLFLARTAKGDVARRLAQSGYLSRVPPRRLWRGERWVPVDPDCAFAPIGRAAAGLPPKTRKRRRKTLAAGPPRPSPPARTTTATKRKLARRTEELEAARQINRELISRVNRHGR